MSTFTIIIRLVLVLCAYVPVFVVLWLLATDKHRWAYRNPYCRTCRRCGETQHMFSWHDGSGSNWQSMNRTHGRYRCDGILPVEIDTIGGNCPVQAEGNIDGFRFYFRARGQAWTLNIGGEDLILNPLWRYEEAYGDSPFVAGWMTVEEAEAFIRKGAARFMDEMAVKL